MKNTRRISNTIYGLLTGSLILVMACDMSDEIGSTELELGSASVTVPGTANLYQNTLYPTFGATPAVPVDGACMGPGGQIDIAATGCAVDAGPSCTGPDGFPGLFRGLRVYSLIGQWSTSPTSLDNSTAVGSSFFIGASNTVTAPSTGGPYYLFLGDNDGIFADNGGAYQVSATWADTDECTCVVDTEAPDVTVSDPQYMSFPRSWVLEEFTLADCVADATDDCDTIDVNATGNIVSIDVDENVLTGNHDCSVTPTPEYCIDVKILDNSTFQVRNTRDSYGDGRVYTVNFTVSDSSGNASAVHSCDIGVRLWSTQVPVAGPAAYTVTP